MNLKNFLKRTFGKDLFTRLKDDEIMEERIKAEKEVERLSDEIKSIQDKIRTLMMESKGQPTTLKALNVSKIKALRMESNAKQQEAEEHLKHFQLLLLIEAMKEHQKIAEHSEVIDKILDADMDSIDQILMDTNVKEALEEGKIDAVKEKLSRVFAKEELPMDKESQQILKAIDELERVDEETALRMAGERAKELAQAPVLKKKEKEYD